MSCFPECSPWCTCVGTDCVPSPVTINALRLAGSHDRWLGSKEVGNGLIEARQAAFLDPAQTFMILSPGVAPLASGDSLSLAVFTSDWIRAASQVRVDHNTVLTPSLATYEVGGPGARVFDSPPFSAGYPAYSGDDPAERIFTMVKLVGGAAAPTGTPINSFDQVVLRINSNRRNIFYFRITDPAANGAEVHGDGTVLGQGGTVFTIVLSEVRAGLGWRPVPLICRECAAINAVVERGVTGTPLAGASAAVDVQGHLYSGTTGTDGRVTLAEPNGNTCVPLGSRTVRASASRYRDGLATIFVPFRGSVQVTVPLACTPVSGQVVDSSGKGQQGITVYLRDVSGVLLRDAKGKVFQSTTGPAGLFNFQCVQHGFVQVWTPTDPSQLQHTSTIGPDGWINITVVVQRTCGDLVGQVLDADTSQPIQSATVTESGGGTTTTDASGSFTFTCVKPAGQHDVFASAAGYVDDFAGGNVPSSGTSALLVIRLHKV
jgi:hypothetical protein